MKREDPVLVYDKISKEYNKMCNHPSDHIDDFLKLLPAKGKVLDVGCGCGGDLVYMKSKGFEVIGVDLSDKMLKLAKEKDKTISFIKKDIRDIKFPDNSFDGILASYSLIHIPKKDILRMLANFHKMLKPEGILCLGLQAGRSEEVYINEPFNPKLKLFVNVFSEEEAKTLLENSGFKIINAFIEKTPRLEEMAFDKLCVIAKKVVSNSL